MARKKHKAGKPPANHPTAGARTRRGGFASFPPPACGEPVWRHLWTLLAVGFALRLLAAFSSDWTYRADEIMQYLEQAHRLVFGAGFVPWEIRLGARNMLLAAPAAGVMALCKSVGGGPDCYIPAIELFCATVSLAIPAALYFIARRLYGETAGRAALVVGCLWYELVVFAPRLMPEQFAAILIFAGLACVPAAVKSDEESSAARQAGLRLFLAGFCLGLGGLLRLQYIPIAGPVGLLLLFRFPLQLAPHLLGGAVAALIVAGGADWLVWGGFYQSAFAFAEISRLTNGLNDIFPDVRGGEWHAQAVKLAICSAGLWPLVFIAAASDWRRHWPALSMVAVLLVVHAVALSISYSHIFIALPLLTLLLGGLAAHPPKFPRALFQRGNRLAAGGVLAAVSALGAAYALPGLSGAFWGELRNSGFFFYDRPAASTGRFLSRVPPDKMRAALWTAVDPLWTGGYYYFHHPVPYWHEGLQSHQRMLAGKPLAQVASHIAAPEPQGAQRALAAGFKEVGNFGGVRVFENPQWEQVAPLEKFPLGLGHQNDADINRALEKAGKTPPPPIFLPPRE